MNETMTSSFRLRDVPEVSVLNLTYSRPDDLASGYVIQVLDDDTDE